MMSAVTGHKTNSTTTKTMNLGFNCPSHFVAMARKALGIPSWRYRYFAAFPNSAMAPKEGAVHGSEIAHVWGTYRSAKATADEVSLSKTMKHAWTEFAKDLKAGLTKLGFPIYDPGADTLIKLGYQNAPNASLARGNFYDEGCDAWVKSNQTFRPMV
jgi:carboxylesterase type B